MCNFGEQNFAPPSQLDRLTRNAANKTSINKKLDCLTIDRDLGQAYHMRAFIGNTLPSFEASPN